MKINCLNIIYFKHGFPCIFNICPHMLRKVLQKLWDSIQLLICSLFGIPISPSAAIGGYRLTIERITRIANSLAQFTGLPRSDQNCLLKENADLLVSLRGAIFFDSRKKGVNQVLISMGIGELCFCCISSDLASSGLYTSETIAVSHPKG